MFQLDRLDHVALSVRDVERSASWYQDVLGFTNLYPGQWDGVPVFVGRDNMAIALFPLKNDGASSASPDRGKPRLLHFAFGATRRNFVAAQRELEKRKISFEFQDHEISHSIYFHDPDGHEIEITTY